MPVYFGMGIVGDIRPSRRNPDENLVCDILDYHAFQVPVPFKGPSGVYLESGGTAGGRFYQQGLRRIDETEFGEILHAGSVVEETQHPPVSWDSLVGIRSAYATVEAAQEVDEYAMGVALDHLRRLFPEDEVVPQPHNNPGFDIRVGSPKFLIRYVEVKGSRAPSPRFFLTEGERLFSIDHSDQYTLFVVYDIDLEHREHQYLVRHGSVSGDAITMAPTQWTCVISRASDGC